MCGIAGFKNNKSLNHTYNINYALSSLRHRGPDEAGYFKNKLFTLINTRLSIQDKKWTTTIYRKSKLLFNL